MIQANELRRGNCIDFDGLVSHVKEIDEQGVVVYIPKTEETEWIDLFQFTGIPITEDILLKAGFEKIPHFTISNSLIKDVGRNRQLSIGCVGNPNEMLFIQELVDDGKTINDLICLHNYDYDKFLFVHRLQNIYHALTGKELTINF